MMRFADACVREAARPDVGTVADRLQGVRVLWCLLVLGSLLLSGSGLAQSGTGDFRVENYVTGIENNNFLWRGYVFRPSRDVVVRGLWGGSGPSCETGGFRAAIFEATITGTGTAPAYDVGSMLRNVQFTLFQATTPEYVAFAQPVTLRSDQFYLIAQGRVSSGGGCHYASTFIDYQNLQIGSAIIDTWYPQQDRAYQPSGSGTGAHLENTTGYSGTTPVRTLVGFRYDTEVEPAVIDVGVPAYRDEGNNVVVESTLLSSGGSGANDELTLYFEYDTNDGFSGATLVPAAPFRVFGPQNNVPFGATLTGLSPPGTTYWVRAVAINESGRVSGEAVPIVPQNLPTGFSVFGTVDGTDGSVTPATRVVIDGETTTFVAQPDPGYMLAEMSGCGGSLEGLTFITGPITASCTVTARFVEEVTCDPATAPASVTVSNVGTSSATVSWTASTGTDPISYHWSVRRASDSVVVASGTSSATSVSASGLSPGTTYVAQVYASNCGGDSATATSSSFTTQKLAQAPVVGVLAHDTITYGADTTTVTASGGSGSGAYEFRQQGGSGQVSFAGAGASRTLTGTAAGSAPIEVRRLGDATYLDSPWVAAGTLTIAQAPLQVVAQDASKVYGDPEPALSYAVVGTLYFGDTEAVVSGVTLSTATGAAATAGTHAINASGGSATNYAITHVPGTLTVAQRPVTVTADDVWKVYAEPAAADPPLTWGLTAGTLAYADTLATVFSGAPARASGEAVGTYAIGQGSLAANANYALTFVPGTLAIRHGPADHLVTVAPVGPEVAGVPFGLVSIVAVDRYGNLADGAHGATPYVGEKTLSYSLSGDDDGPTAGTDTFTTQVTFVAGEATTTLTTVLHRAQTTTISANDAALPNVEDDVPSAPFEVRHAQADHLHFRTQPASTRSAVPFAEPPSVQVLDEYGNLATGFVGDASFALIGATASLEPSGELAIPAEDGIATLPCSWVDAPALGVQLHASSGGLASATSTAFDVTGALVRGVVYVDATAAGTRPPGAPPIAGAHVGLVDVDGEPVSWPDGGTLDGAVCAARETDVSITDALGRYRAPGLDAGTFELVVRGDPDDGSVDVAGVTTTLTSLARVGSDPFEITAPAFGRYEVDVGFFPGAFVEGVVFRDDGGATGDGLSGRANDAERDPGESGIGGVVIVSLPEGVRAVASGPDGRYRLALPMTEATSVTVGHDRGRASGHTLTSGTDVTTVLATGTVGHYASFAALPGGVHRLDFGLVPQLRLVGDGAQSVTSPGVARFELLLEPGTPGEVRLEALHGSEAWTVRLDPSDSACAEALAVEGDGGAWRLIGAWPQRPDGALLPCPVLVDLHVPSGRPVGDVQDLLLRAVSSWERPDGAPAVSDASGTSLLRTTVVDAGRVALRFDASSDGGDTFAARVEAAPRTAVLYRVRYGNPGTQPVRDVAVRVPIDSAYLAPPVSGPLGIVAVVCPDHGQPAAATTLPYDAVTRLITLDLEAVCGISELAPGASGELLVELELR